MLEDGKENIRRGKTYSKGKSPMRKRRKSIKKRGKPARKRGISY